MTAGLPKQTNSKLHSNTQLMRQAYCAEDEWDDCMQPEITYRGTQSLSRNIVSSITALKRMEKAVDLT